MFERFSEETRQVVVCAEEEARRLGHSYVGTEHLLLGVLRVEERRGDRVRPLASLGVTLEEARERTTRILRPGEEATIGSIPLTPRANTVLEVAAAESRTRGDHSIEPEHIVLGLAVANSGVAYGILLDVDAYPEKVRQQVGRVLDDRQHTRPASQPD